MKITRAFLTSIICFLSLPLFSNLVQVTKLRGNATFLSNGMRDAKPLTLNQWIPKDTSVLTSEKSFLVLTYKTGTEIILGPNSKLIVDEGKNRDQQLVSLLIGKFKATVKNQAQSNENKMIIKTRGAALGIRGTVFQTSYNPASNITSLITFHGAVAMAKIENKPNENSKNIEELESSLKNNSVVVNLGEYSGVSDNNKNVTAPVKISPEQFSKLKLTQTLGAVEEKIDSTELQKEILKTEESYQANSQTEQKNSNTNKNTVTNRAGGFVDIESGVYVPPPSTSTLNTKLAIYETSEKMGKLDNSGNYIPPKGLILDPIKGFVVDEKVASEETKIVAKDLNESVNKQVQKTEVIKKKKALDNTDDDVYKKYYDPSKI